MAVFEKHARYYDLFNDRKDYEGECDFLEEIFGQFAERPVQTILDLGCGTGGHSIPLTRRGYQVAGADVSEEMLSIARRKAFEANLPVEFHAGDVRNVNLERRFDAVISMFAVVVYMVKNRELASMFQTARRHVRPGGLFVFDSWYGPAVLTDRPRDTLKIVEPDDGRRIMRYVQPDIDVLQHMVTLNYTIVELDGDRVLDQTDEVHPLRFLFPQEVAYYMETSGFEVVRLCPFPELGRELTGSDWYMTVIARAVD